MATTYVKCSNPRCGKMVASQFAAALLDERGLCLQCQRGEQRRVNQKPKTVEK